MTNIQERLFNIFITEFAINPADLKLDSRLCDDLGMSITSTDAVELLSKIEEEFGIGIPNEEFNNVVSIADLINVIKNNMNEK